MPCREPTLVSSRSIRACRRGRARSGAGAHAERVCLLPAAVLAHVGGGGVGCERGHGGGAACAPAGGRVLREPAAASGRPGGEGEWPAKGRERRGGGGGSGGGRRRMNWWRARGRSCCRRRKRDSSPSSTSWRCRTARRSRWTRSAGRRPTRPSGRGSPSACSFARKASSCARTATRAAAATSTTRLRASAWRSCSTTPSSPAPANCSPACAPWPRAARPRRRWRTAPSVPAARSRASACPTRPWRCATGACPPRRTRCAGLFPRATTPCPSTYSAKTCAWARPAKSWSCATKKRSYSAPAPSKPRRCVSLAPPRPPPRPCTSAFAAKYPYSTSPTAAGSSA